MLVYIGPGVGPSSAFEFERLLLIALALGMAVLLLLDALAPREKGRRWALGCFGLSWLACALLVGLPVLAVLAQEPVLAILAEDHVLAPSIATVLFGACLVLLSGPGAATLMGVSSGLPSLARALATPDWSAPDRAGALRGARG